MRNFLLGTLFATAVVWIAVTGFLSYQCIGATDSEWLWRPMSMGMTEYWHRVDNTWACTLDHVADVAGREAVYYYWNVPGMIIGLTMLVLWVPTLLRPGTQRLDRDDVRRKAKRRL
jgi:hypothetical protein